MISEKEELTKKLSLPKNSTNNLLMINIKKEHDNVLNELIKKFSSECNNICYVCLSKKSSQVLDEFKNFKSNFKGLTFIDIFSSGTKYLKNDKNFIYVKEPNNLQEINNAVNKAVYKNKCSTVIYDTISKLLVYQTPDRILKFTHKILSNPKQKETHKLFINLRKDNIYKDENTKLIKDLSLFADKIVEI